MLQYRLSSEAVCKAAAELAAGTVHASLGSGVYKQRVARVGQGKSGGFRTILFFREGERAFFITGFAKNERENLLPRELVALKMLAKEMLGYDDSKIERAIASGALEELDCERAL